MSISNLKIGRKLAIASGLGILVVMAMLFNSWRGDGMISDALQRLSRQKQTAFHAANGQNQLRPAQLALADIRLTVAVDKIGKMAETMRDAVKAGIAEIDAAQQLETVPQNRERFETIKTLIGRYEAAAQEMVDAQT